MPEPAQLASLVVDEQWLYSKLLLGDRAPHSFSKGVPCHPSEETCICLYSFGDKVPDHR